MAHLDRFGHQEPDGESAIGAIAGFFYQFEDDDSAYADGRADGFKGRSIAIGPLVSYKAKFGETEIDFRLKWAHEVEVETPHEGRRGLLRHYGEVLSPRS